MEKQKQICVPLNGRQLKNHLQAFSISPTTKVTVHFENEQFQMDIQDFDLKDI